MPGKANGNGREAGKRQTAKGKRAAAAEIQREERRIRALQLRRQGASIRQIAAAENVSPQTICNDLAAALQATIDERNSGAEQLRALELERLDSILVALQNMVFPKDKTETPRLGAVDRMLRISEQRAKLLGLYSQEINFNIRYPQLSELIALLEERNMSAGDVFEALIQEIQDAERTDVSNTGSPAAGN